jgi:hypothetical protein
MNRHLQTAGNTGIFVIHDNEKARALRFLAFPYLLNLLFYGSLRGLRKTGVLRGQPRNDGEVYQKSGRDATPVSPGRRCQCPINRSVIGWGGSASRLCFGITPLPVRCSVMLKRNLLRTRRPVKGRLTDHKRPAPRQTPRGILRIPSRGIES